MTCGRSRGFQDASGLCGRGFDGGTVALKEDGYSAEFTPAKNFHGLAAFRYTVKGNDGSEYAGRVEVLVERSEESIVDSSDVEEDKTALSAINSRLPRFGAAVRNGMLKLFGIPEDATVSLYDLGGKKLLETRAELSEGGTAISLESFDRGVYVVKVRELRSGFNRTVTVSR